MSCEHEFDKEQICTKCGKGKTILDYQRDPGGLTFGQGHNAAHMTGVMFECSWQQLGDGFSEHGRRTAYALSTTGCPVHLRTRTYTAKMLDVDERPSWIEDMLATSVRGYSFVITHALPYDSLLHSLVTNPMLSTAELIARNERRILSTVFEADRVSQPAVGALNQFGQIWVACEANRQVLVRSGVMPELIKVIPIPHFRGDPLLELRKLSRRPGPPRFYHIGKWEPRKAQDKLLEAFLMAFEPGEAQLCFKTSRLVTKIHGYFPGPQECLAALLQYPHIRARGWTPEKVQNDIEIFDQRLSEKNIRKIHELGDVYLSLSRGEGFDMPAYDAKLAGNILVYTPSGGPQDFADASDFLVPTNGYIPASPFYRWSEGSQYFDWKLMDAISQMRRAASVVRMVGSPKPSIMTRFEMESVGYKMLDALREIAGDGVYDLTEPTD